MWYNNRFIFESDKRKTICVDENKTNSTFLHIVKHNTNDHIVQVDESFLNVKKIKGDKFCINSLERFSYLI